MRGASLILAKSGRRVEPDMDRGVRVSRMGIEKSVEKNLSEKLSRKNKYNPPDAGERGINACIKGSIMA